MTLIISILDYFIVYMQRMLLFVTIYLLLLLHCKGSI